MALARVLKRKAPFFISDELALNKLLKESIFTNVEQWENKFHLKYQ